MKALIWTGLFIGSTIGGFIPSLWGEGIFSLSSILFSALGGVLGILAGMKLGERLQ